MIIILLKDGVGGGKLGFPSKIIKEYNYFVGFPPNNMTTKIKSKSRKSNSKNSKIKSKSKSQKSKTTNYIDQKEEERKNYYNLQKKTFIDNFAKYKFSNIHRLFGAFLTTLYFWSNQRKDDVLIEIDDKNKQAFDVIKQFAEYEKILLEENNNYSNFIEEWNNKTKQFEIIIATIEEPKTPNNSLKYNPTTQKLAKYNLHQQLYKKLKKAYTTHNTSNIPTDKAIATLIYRYTYFNLLSDNSQLALDNETKQKLAKEYNIDTELFASPFNYYFANYYSLFPIMEKHFGSKGSFNDYLPPSQEQSQQSQQQSITIFSNPPFEEEILKQTSKKYIQFFHQNPTLTIITTIPNWSNEIKNDKEQPTIQYLQQNRENYADYQALYIVIPYLQKIIRYKNGLTYQHHNTKNKTNKIDTLFLHLGGTPKKIEIQIYHK